MCGIYYSTVKAEFEASGLKRRGPEGWTTLENHQGYFAHSLLSTIGAPTKQPITTDHGTLLYNGSTYNQKDNDSQWIADNLGHGSEQCIEFIRTLIGEYALVWNTETHTIFCSDVFSVRPLYYWADHSGINVASLPQALKQFPTQYKCEGNKIYTYDKRTKQIAVCTNKHFDLTQTATDYDAVFESFEQAVMDRHTDDNLYTVSAGYDSGAIACCAEKKFNSFKGSFVYPNAEDKHVLAARAKRHRLKPEHFKQEHEDTFSHTEIDTILNARNPEVHNEYATHGLTSMIMQLMKPNNMKIMIIGSGGDEIYADNGFGGKCLEWHKISGEPQKVMTKFGGHFPENLELVWPWHNNTQYQHLFTEKHEAVGGYWGIEVRCPMLDTRVVQSWLNTTSSLKNTEYKGWMAEYMRQHDYPFHASHRKTVFSY